jgi:hypothetical protein
VDVWPKLEVIAIAFQICTVILCEEEVGCLWQSMVRECCQLARRNELKMSE